MKKGFLIVSPLLCFLIIWGGCLIKCEILTFCHEEEFTQAYLQNPMLLDQEYAKVIRYGDESARVYYVSQQHQSADLLDFKKVEGQWMMDGWSTVWSRSGSASEVIWPYWWHVIYSGV